MLLTALLPADSSVTAAPIFRLLDIIVTGLALMGGVEKLPELLKIGKETGGAFASASTSESPIKVEGKLFRTNRDSASHDARILVRSTDRQRLGQNRESSRFGVLASSSPNRPTWTDLSISCRASFQADCQVRMIAATAAHSSRCSTRIASLKRTCMFRR